MATRGMNMRDMDARKLGRQSALAVARAERQRAGRKRRGTEAPPLRDEEIDDLELGDGEALVDQGDGMYVQQRTVDRGEPSERECPDEPPPGWCEG